MTQTPEPYPKRAASASCVAGLLAWIIPFLLRNSVNASRARGYDEWRLQTLVIGISTAIILLIGVALAVVALRGMKQYGRKGILSPALLGLVINGLGIALFVLGFIMAANRN